MSPSPEVELFSPELDEGTPAPPTPGESFSGRSSLNPDGTHETRPQQRAPSPGLEADEKGFTETASAVRASRLMQHRNLPLRSRENIYMTIPRIKVTRESKSWDSSFSVVLTPTSACRIIRKAC